MNVSQETLNRLFWHSRRGMLELDVLLVPFVKEAYIELATEEQQHYTQMITHEDPELYAWLIKRESAPEIYQPLIRKILDHAGAMD